MLYLTVVLISIALITGANLLFIPSPSLEACLMMLLSVTFGAVAAFAIDGTSAFVIRRLTPARWYESGRRIFKVSKREKNLYNKINIKAWKDRIPELGGFTGLHKDRLESTCDAEYLRRFILESNYGVIIHVANALLGAAVAFLPFCRSPMVWVPIFAVNFILSILPVAVLRYTVYYLERILLRAERKMK